MRVYVPATFSLLQELVTAGQLDRAPITAFAVTPGLREWYVDEDIEELEYAAAREAARSSLRLIDADPMAVRRRVVLSVDVDDASVEVRDDLDRGVVSLRAALPLSAVACVHVDDEDAEPAIGAAAAAMLAADLGDAKAEDTVDDAEGYELSWYDRQELTLLVQLH
jgi:hypothetical protein